MRGIDRANAVELEVPVLAAIVALEEYLDTGVLAHRRLVGIVHGTEIVAPHKEIDIEVLARMCRHKACERPVRKLFFPVATTYGLQRC